MVAFCLKIIWLIVLTRLLFLPLLLGLGFALAASALERHITSNPADGCAALIATKRAANYPDILAWGRYLVNAHNSGCAHQNNDFERTPAEFVLSASRRLWSHILMSHYKLTPESTPTNRFRRPLTSRQQLHRTVRPGWQKAA